VEEKRTTTVVKINNAEYRIVCEADEEYVRHVAYHVDKKMRELISRDKRLSTSMAAVLTAVNVCDEYMQAQEDNEKLRAQLLKYAEEAGASKLALDKMNAELNRLRAENQSLKMNVVKLETELKNRKYKKREKGALLQNMSFVGSVLFVFRYEKQ